MAISAINSNSSLLPRTLAQAKSHDVATSSQNKIVKANADGDTLKLSDKAQHAITKAVYSQPKPVTSGTADKILKPA